MSKELELTEQTGLNEIEKYELLHREEVENTPFNLITTEKGHFACLGKYRISDVMQDKAALKDRLWCKDWDILLSTMYAIVKSELENK